MTEPVILGLEEEKLRWLELANVLSLSCLPETVGSSALVSFPVLLETGSRAIEQGS